MNMMCTPDPAAADLARFAARPWRQVRDEELGAARAVPTMLSRMERRLYLWLAEHWATGAGAIVDLGCFAGGSAAHLAEGVRRAGRPLDLHAFDRFRASDEVKELTLYPAGIPRFEEEDLLPLARRLLAPWAPGIRFHKGEIEQQDWTGGPIELLAIDAAKTAAGMDRMAEMFFPALIPGHSLVLQQDFLHWKVPWIPVQMERMAEWFEPVAFCPRDTVVYLCRKPVDARALEAGRVSGLSDAELLAGLAGARRRLAAWAVDERIEAQSRAVLLNPNRRRAKDYHVRPA